MKTETGQVEEYTVSYQNLLPSTQYEFRLIAYNAYGISYPAVAAEKVSQFETHLQIRLTTVSCLLGMCVFNWMLGI